MKRKILTIIIALLVVSVVTAAAVLFVFPFDPMNPPSANETGSTVEGIQAVVDANNMFAFDLFSEYSVADVNSFFSPYSISSALAITYEGARGQTAQEMKNVSYFPETEILRPNFAAIYNGINGEHEGYTLRTGNALWVQYDYGFVPEYLSDVVTYYGGLASNLDFVNELEKSRKTINSFIEDQTNNKIKEIIPEGSLRSDTKMVISNAIYFKGDWEYDFKKSNTDDERFYLPDGDNVIVPMMEMDDDDSKFNYGSFDEVQMIEMPYEGNEISMLVVLPKQGTFYDIRKDESYERNYTLDSIDLSYEKLIEYKSQMREAHLDKLKLPRFEFKTKYLMKDTLVAMGMPTAFTPGADFSGMTKKPELMIDQVIHQAFISVDEKGTISAAATGVIMSKTTAAMPMNNFIADHPFMFIIQEKATGNILFMGRVNNPIA